MSKPLATTQIPPPWPLVPFGLPTIATLSWQSPPQPFVPVRTPATAQTKAATRGTPTTKY